MAIRCAILILLGLPLLAGCDEAPSRPAIEVAGTFAYGFETSALDPCGTSESWWVTNPEVLAAQYASVASQSYERVFVSVMGEKSAPGRFGHFGAYSREFTVSEVHVVRALVDGDCQ